MDFIAEILSYLIRPIYGLVNNYGLTIIIATILIKLITMPFTVKSQKSMARMQQVQPLISEVQRKYANNREKQQQELMKIYDKYQISPTGGCLPMIFQLVILMGFIQIVYKPYTFILGIPKTAIETIVGKEFVGNQLGMTAEHLAKLAEEGYKTNLDLNFLGFDLTKILQQNMGDILMWVLPVIALALTILQTIISQRSANKKQNPNAKKDAQAQQAQAMSKSMLFMMPVMTAWITYTMPLGCALYWSISTLTQMLQQFIVDKFIVSKMKPIELKKKKKKTTQKPKPVIDVEETEDVVSENQADDTKEG